ncbi:MAG: hypothetical protein F4Z88_05405 [Chloroflexi bacterium]|nr:hypothetical protein [Chloroflexota bacterium]
MSGAELQARLLRWLAAMPFLDRLELAAVSGVSERAAYYAMAALEDAGLAAALPHGSDLIRPTRRFHVTARGLRRLAADEGVPTETLLRTHPVSAQWRRILLQRLDAVAVIYRLAAAVAAERGPLRGFRWFRATALDAAFVLPDGRSVGVVRQGPTADRTAFAKRLRRLYEGRLPGALLVLASDGSRLQHTRRLLDGLPMPTFIALERDAASAAAHGPVWNTPSADAALSLRTALSGARPARAMPAEKQRLRASIPADLPRGCSSDPAPGQLLPARLRPAEKRALDLLAEWPWLTPAHLGALLGVGSPRLSQVMGRLQALRLTVSVIAGERRRFALTDRGLALVARRDRVSVGAARGRWSAAPVDPYAPLTWRNVSGARSRQLLRNIEHTEAVHGFAAGLAEQARSTGCQVAQFDPPHRASRFFRHRGRLHSIRPDAFGILRGGDRPMPFFLEWERRAVRPVTMAARLAPYLRYFASARDDDGNGMQPALLVVFEDELTAVHFLRVARRETARTGVRVPLWVSHTGLLDREGPLGRAWLAQGGWEPRRAFPMR